MRWSALAVAVGVAAMGAGCKSHDSSPTPPAAPKRDAAAVAVDWAACGSALQRATTAGTHERARIVIEGCRVCGDWHPLLDWSHRHEDGGPTRTEIDDAMARCDAWCEPNARQRFLGTLDDARGTPSRSPWRNLGEVCKAKVSAVPDTRYMSAPYFALDRIARAAAAHGGDVAALAGKLELALPAVSVTGSGLELPTFPPNETADRSYFPAPRHALSLIGPDLFASELPIAHLAADGIHVDYAGPPYPGRQIAPGELATLWTDAPRPEVVVLAPAGAPAASLVDLVARAGSHYDLRLAASVPHLQDYGWTIPMVLPVSLDPGAQSRIAVTAKMTVQQLFEQLEQQHDRVALVHQ